MNAKNKSRRLPIIFYLSFLGLFLFSCTTQNAERIELTAVVPQTTGTAILLNQTLVATSSITPTPTATPNTSFIPINYELPVWMSNEKNVLMIVTDISETTNQLLFVNASTGEKYAISVSLSNIRGYFWTPDGKNFGFLSSDDKTIYLVDTFSGKVGKIPVDKQSTILLNKGDNRNKYTLERLGIFGSFSNNDVSFYYCRLCYSFDLTQTIDKKYPMGEYNEPQISVKNILAGDEILLTKPDDKIYDFETVWSPNKFEIAILQGSQPAEPDYIQFGDWPGNRITLYNTKTGQIIDTYQGNFASISWHWSPDGEKILYINLPESQDYNGTKLCILYLDTKTSQCIDKLQNTKTNSFSFFSWSDDGKKIYYINYAPEPHRSDLCVYNIRTTDINCPTKNITELDYLNIEGYTASPDGNYFLISYGNSCNTCDYWGEPSIAIVSNEGDGFILLGKQVFKELKDGYVFYPKFSNSIWRPITKP
jgi:Tol biopolymer transport system component